MAIATTTTTTTMAITIAQWAHRCCRPSRSALTPILLPTSVTVERRIQRRSSTFSMPHAPRSDKSHRLSTAGRPRTTISAAIPTAIPAATTVETKAMKEAAIARAVFEATSDRSLPRALIARTSTRASAVVPVSRLHESIQRVLSVRPPSLHHTRPQKRGYGLPQKAHHLDRPTDSCLTSEAIDRVNSSA